MSNRFTRLSGFLAALLHMAVLMLFGFGTSAFWQPHHAISDMGMYGKANRWIVNLFGFVVPGLLIMVFGCGLHAWLRKRGRFGAVLISLGGMSFGLAGLYPYPMVMHVVAAASAAFFLGTGIASLAPVLGDLFSCPYYKAISIVVALLVISNISLPFLSLSYLGYYQKSTFALGLLWLLLTSGRFATEMDQRTFSTSFNS